MKTLVYKNVIQGTAEDINGPNLESAEIKSKFKKIFEEIAASPDLETLKMSGNSMTENELGLLAEVLNGNKQLERLCLNYNYLGAAAMPFLKKIILEHPHLTTVDLNFNEITDEAIEALLPTSTEEKMRFQTIKIEMTNNKITETGIKKANNQLSSSSILTMLAFNLIEMDKANNYCKQITEQEKVVSTSQNPPIIHSNLGKAKTEGNEVGIGLTAASAASSTVKMKLRSYKKQEE